MINMDISLPFSRKKPDIPEMMAKRDFRGLIRALTHKDLETVIKAAHALGELGKGDIDPLVHAFRRRNKYIRIGIIEAFAEIGDPLTLDLLMTALRDPNNEVRWEAALAIGEFHNVKAIEPLMNALRDPDIFVRYGAALALDKTGWTPQNDLEIGFYALGKQDWDRLKDLGTAAFLPLTHASRDKNTYVRAKALELLGSIGDEKAIPLLYQSLKDKEEFVRWNAVMAATECGIPSMYIPRGLSRRPHFRKNPFIAGLLNFLLPGLGYQYLGKWWGVLVFQIDVTITLWLFAYRGATLTYSTILPIYTLLAVHAWYLARKMSEL